MTYTVYTEKKTNYGYITSVKRKSVSKEIALEIQTKCMANPNRTCRYVVVADCRINDYLADREKRSVAIRTERDRKWAFLEEMNKRGYHTNDTIAFLNKSF